jgi:cysteine-rich repeat protein
MFANRLLAAAVLLLAPGCDCGTGTGADDDARDGFVDGLDAGGEGADADVDGGSDDAPPGDGESPEEGTVYPPVTEVEVCGNGVLDPGEECDDGNRLNGDTCDWLCRTGAGDPAPDPDPDVPEYVPAGDSIVVPSATPTSPPSFERLPLCWTGEHYATAYAVDVPDGEPPALEFRRLAADGSTVDAPWRYAAPAYYGGLDLVWTGAGFGLFYVDLRSGLYYMRLDVDGKPLTEPRLVQADVRVRAPAADWDGASFVVAWVREMGDVEGWSWCSRDVMPDQVQVRRVELFGDTTGAAITVDDTAQGPPDIAAGEGGYGLAMTVETPGESFCGLRFTKLDESLGSPVASGFLSSSEFADVKWVEGRYVTASSLQASPRTDPEATELVVAWFTAAGELGAPPVRNPSIPELLSSSYHLAGGDRGLALVAVTNMESGLLFRRTDLAGVALGLGQPVAAATAFGTRFGPCNVVWDAGGFAVLYTGMVGWPDISSDLYLRRFVAE